MTDYFGYDVHFVMNVTDIDNKVQSYDWDDPVILLMSHTRSSTALDRIFYWISFVWRQPRLLQGCWRNYGIRGERTYKTSLAKVKVF